MGWKFDGIRGSPELCVERSCKVIFLPFRSGTLTLGRQVLRYRIGYRYFAFLHHIHEHQGCKHFGHGADLEDGVAIERPLVILRETAVGDNPPAFCIDDADHHADAGVLRTDAVGENFVDLGVRWQGGINGGLGERQSPQQKHIHSENASIARGHNAP